MATESGSSEIHFPSGAIAKVPIDTQFIYVATIPRSGTWYLHYLLEYFYSALDPPFQVEHQVIFKHYPQLNLANLVVHSTCPGFRENYRGPLRAAWDALPTEEWFDSDYKYASLNAQHFSPYINNRARIVLLFRNPLDQSVSLFNHMKGHSKLADFLARFATPGDFLRRSNLDAYLKLYVSFAETASLFPHNVLMMPYENLREDTAQALSTILSFMGADLGPPERGAAVMAATEAASTSNMRKLEQTLGRSLANDQSSPSASHIKHADRGLWRQELTDADISFARDRLSLFGYRLESFAL